MNLTYDNIPSLFAAPFNDKDYCGSAAEDEVIGALYGRHQMIEHLFIMHPPFNHANRVAIVTRVSHAVVNAALKLSIGVKRDQDAFDRLLNMADEPLERDAIWDEVKDYLHPAIVWARSEGWQSLPDNKPMSESWR